MSAYSGQTNADLFKDNYPPPAFFSFIPNDSFTQGFKEKFGKAADQSYLAHFPLAMEDELHSLLRRNFRGSNPLYLEFALLAVTMGLLALESRIRPSRAANEKHAELATRRLQLQDAIISLRS